jgi:hypothetical protein
MQHINKHGLITFGRHKGKRLSQVPSGWVEWAKENVSGFTASVVAYEALLSQPKPAGRTYILKPFHKKAQ